MAACVHECWRCHGPVPPGQPADMRVCAHCGAYQSPQPEKSNMTDEAIEREIQAKGLTAPRVTPQALEDNIAEEIYIRPHEAVEARGGQVAASSPLRLLTICVLILRNGFTVTGESACASPENFNAELGRKIAREHAKQKLWPLMGYALREQLSRNAG